jgi:hypothetical protein
MRNQEGMRAMEIRLLIVHVMALIFIKT